MTFFVHHQIMQFLKSPLTHCYKYNHLLIIIVSEGLHFTASVYSVCEHVYDVHIAMIKALKYRKVKNAQK